MFIFGFKINFSLSEKKIEEDIQDQLKKSKESYEKRNKEAHSKFTEKEVNYFNLKNSISSKLY